MALGAETVRPFPAAADAVPVFLATDEGRRPVDPMIWGDEGRMKRELVAWAKAVASMAVHGSSPSPSTSSPSMRYKRR
ncbi:hypothetical protein ABZP36_011552 [Zizania latifolia]